MNTDAANILKEYKLKVTPIRLAVLGVFSHDCKPVNAEYVFEKLKKDKVNLVTVYRTLTTLSQKGILNLVNISAGSAHYEMANHHHHHLVCSDCGDIEKISICSSLLNKDAISQSKKFKKIQSHSVEFFGICKKCSA
jgi:Fe2+ or Zn2+ uptake regulation protein